MRYALCALRAGQGECDSGGLYGLLQDDVSSRDHQKKTSPVGAFRYPEPALVAESARQSSEQEAPFKFSAAFEQQELAMIGEGKQDHPIG